jgi:hypothetical protein
MYIHTHTYIHTFIFIYAYFWLYIVYSTYILIDFITIILLCFYYNIQCCFCTSIAGTLHLTFYSSQLRKHLLLAKRIFYT